MSTDATTDTETAQPQPVRHDYCLTRGPDDTQWLIGQLGAERLEDFYRRGEDVVRASWRGEADYIAAPVNPHRDPAELRPDHGPATIAPISTVGLAGIVEDRYSIVRYDGRSKTYKPAFFTPESCRRVLDRGMLDQLHSLREIRGVSHTPFARRDKGLVTRPGYDPASGFLLLPDVLVDPVPEDPTPAEVAAARETVLGLLSDFVFVNGNQTVTTNGNEKANYLGMLFMPLLREAVPDAFKLCVIQARQPGSGKTLLAQLIRHIHGGSVQSMPTSEEEFEKQVGSVLTITTAPVVLIDNVRGRVVSKELENLTTIRDHSARILGFTSRKNTINDRLWLMTANNMEIGGDLERRTLWATIDPGVPHPEHRDADTFAIPDLEGYVQTHRARILAALLTLIAAWDAAGRPGEPAVGSESFSRWRGVLRGLFDHVGITEAVGGVFDHNDAVHVAADPEAMEWTRFLTAIKAATEVGVLGEQWRVKDLLAVIDARRGTVLNPMPGQTNAALPETDQARQWLYETLPDDLIQRAETRHGGRVGSLNKSLGRWFSYRNRRWFGGMAVERVDEDRTGSVWRLTEHHAQ